MYTTEHGLPSNEILGLQPQADGFLRVLTSAGIGWFADGQCTRSTTAIDGRPIGRVFNMATDSAGTTWLATQDRGVISLDGRAAPYSSGHRDPPDGKGAAPGGTQSPILPGGHP